MCDFTIFTETASAIGGTIVERKVSNAYNQLQVQIAFKNAISQWEKYIREDIENPNGLSQEQIDVFVNLIKENKYGITESIKEIAESIDDSSQERTSVISLVHNSIHSKCTDQCHLYTTISKKIDLLIHCYQDNITSEIDPKVLVLANQSQNRIAQQFDDLRQEIKCLLKDDKNVDYKSKVPIFQQFSVIESTEAYQYFDDKCLVMNKYFLIQSNIENLDHISFWVKFVGSNNLKKQNKIKFISPEDAEWQITEDRIDRNNNRVIEITVHFAKLHINNSLRFHIQTIQPQLSSAYSISVQKYDTKQIKKRILFSDNTRPRTVWKADISVNKIDCICEHPSFPHTLLNIKNGEVSVKWKEEEIDNQQAYVLYWHL